VDDIAELNQKCRLRPDLTQTLLPYLGKDNLLFQKGHMIKDLRLRYGSMTQSAATLEQAHQVTIQLLEERSKAWDSAKTVDLHDALDTIIYDVMGEVIFGGTWTDKGQGQAIRKEHLYLIKWSSRYGMEVLKEPSWSNLFKAPADLRAYFASIKELRRICEGMLESRRQAIEANPEQWADDETALTMLITNKTSEKDPSPFFSKHLSVSTCIGFLNGAYDTTHSTAFWVFYHLARYPQEQERLAQELAKICGDRVPTVAELRNCELLAAFLFALAELNAMIARTVQKFKISLADPEMAEPDMIYEAGVYQPATHFHFVLKAR